MLGVGQIGSAIGRIGIAAPIKGGVVTIITFDDEDTTEYLLIFEDLDTEEYLLVAEAA